MLFMPIWAAAISAPRASLRSVALRNVPAGTEPRLLFLLAKEEKEAKRRMTKGFNNTANLIEKSAWFGHSRKNFGLFFLGQPLRQHLQNLAAVGDRKSVV